MNPLLAAEAGKQVLGGVGGFFSKNAGSIGLFLAALVAWFWLRPYFRVLFGLVPDDAKLQAGGGDVTAQFYADRKNKARRLHESLTANALTSSGRCEATYDALQWNDNELRVMYNTYKNSYGDTLLEAVKGVYTDDCGWFGMSEGLNGQLIAKLNAAGLV